MNSKNSYSARDPPSNLISSINIYGEKKKNCFNLLIPYFSPKGRIIHYESEATKIKNENKLSQVFLLNVYGKLELKKSKLTKKMDYYHSIFTETSVNLSMCSHVTLLPITSVHSVTSASSPLALHPPSRWQEIRFQTRLHAVRKIIRVATVM